MQEPGDDDRRHWDAVYARTGPAGVSWYQPEAVVSLELIDRLAIPPDTPAIDVGGGASTLVDQLLRRGFSDLTVVDVSASALDTVRRRLGEDAHKVHLLRESVIHGWNPSRQYGLWHDRAVFHFFVDEADRARYRNVLRSALRDDGVALVATFAADGPERCSGLPVARYGPDALVAALGDDLEMLMSGVRSTERRPVPCNPSPGSSCSGTNGPDNATADAARRVGSVGPRSRSVIYLTQQHRPYRLIRLARCQWRDLDNRHMGSSVERSNVAAVWHCAW